MTLRHHVKKPRKHSLRKKAKALHKKKAMTHNPRSSRSERSFRRGRL